MVLQKDLLAAVLHRFRTSVKPCHCLPRLLSGRWSTCRPQVTRQVVRRSEKQAGQGSQDAFAAEFPSHEDAIISAGYGSPPLEPKEHSECPKEGPSSPHDVAESILACIAWPSRLGKAAAAQRQQHVYLPRPRQHGKNRIKAARRGPRLSKFTDIPRKRHSDGS